MSKASPLIHTPKPIIKPEDITMDDLNHLAQDSFALWALTCGAKVDNNDVEFDHHRYLLPIYMDDNNEIAWQKAAQMGATVYMLLRVLWWLYTHQGRKAGLYMPNKELVDNTSKDRLTPLINSVPPIAEICNPDDKLGLRTVGSSSFYLFHLGGKSSKDSVPLDYISFDEVRLCRDEDVYQALERISHSSHKMKVFMSTCLAGDTPVIVREKTTGFVSYKQLQALQSVYAQYQVLSYNRLGGYRARWRDITAVHNNGVKPVVKATFEGGHTLVCTTTHKFAVHDKDTALFGESVFRPLQEIPRHRSGHQPAPVRPYALTKIPTSVGAPFDLTTCEFVGLYAAEGSLSGREDTTVTIWQSNKSEKNTSVRDLAKDWAKNQGLSCVEKSDGIHISGLNTRPDLKKLLQDCGPTAPEKRIPQSVLCGNEAQMRHVLHGFLLGDGHFVDHQTSNREFDLFTTSEQLAQDLQLVCHKVGKPVSITRRARAGKPVIIAGMRTGESHHVEIRLTYNKESHRHEELIRDLGGIALTSIEDAGNAEVWDLSVDTDPYYMVGPGLLVHNCGLPDQDINLRFQDGSQHIWMAKCFDLDQQLVVRRKTEGRVSSSPELKTLRELQSEWPLYQALSCDVQHKKLQYRDITAFHDNGEAEVVQVLFDDGSTVVCTPDHEFAWHNGKPIGGGGKTSFAAITELNKDLRYDKNNLLAARTFATEQYEVQLRYDLLTYYVFGAYLAEGSWPTATIVEFTQLKGKFIWNKVQQWASLHGLRYTVTDSSVRVSLHTKPELLSIFRGFGKGCDKKRIGKWILGGDSQQLSSLLEGYLDGDGHRKKSGYWEAVTTSEILSHELQFVAMRAGFSTRRKPNKVQDDKKPTWTISYSPNVRREKNPLSSHVGTAKMVEIRTFGTRRVADITVDKNHNYVLANGFIAHNCGCPDGVDLARTFPDCVVADDKRRPDPYLRCPKCKYEIKDPQNGRYVPHNPGADYNSYHVSQLSSKFISLKEIWKFWQRTRNVAEFYNAKLGLPYVDEQARGVTMTQLEASVDPHMEWGKAKQRENFTAMGVDQGGGYCMAVIADNSDNKKRVRHVEIIEQDNPAYREPSGAKNTPFKRLGELMDEYNVRICVVDAMPNMNDALQFAQRFPGRVFLAYYAKDQKEIVQWNDKAKGKITVKKAGPLLKFKYVAILGRFPSMDFALGEWAAGNVKIPNLDKRRQMAFDEKTTQLMPEAPARRLFSHLVRLIKRFHETNEETGDGRWEWIYTGGDPHMAHAWSYCNVALERLRRQVIFCFA